MSVSSARAEQPVPHAAAAKDGGLVGFIRVRRYVLYRIAGMAAFLGGWQLASSTGLVNALYASSPWGWSTKGIELLADGTLAGHIAATARVLFIGLLIGSVLGFVAGLLIGLSRAFQAATNDIFAALYALPYIAFLPLVIVWFGIEDAGRVFIVVYAVFFPVLMNTASGVRTVEPHLLQVAEAFCASRVTIVRTVVLPGALPFVLTGLRLAIGRGLVGVVTAEFFMSSRGLGYFIYSSASHLDSDAAFSGIVILAALGILLTRFVEGAERRVYQRWGKS
jgi:ABC-type nitrate/sulfonate/bicarbonate transport system permease component